MNKVNYFIEEIEKKYLICFKPTRQFYKKIMIGQRRWHQLLRDEVSPTIKELRELSKYFDIPLNELIIEDENEKK